MASTRKRPVRKNAPRGEFAAPATITLPPMLSAGSDVAFREALYLMVLAFGRLHSFREAFGGSLDSLGKTSAFDDCRPNSCASGFKSMILIRMTRRAKLPFRLFMTCGVRCTKKPFVTLQIFISATDRSSMTPCDRTSGALSQQQPSRPPWRSGSAAVVA